MLAESSTYKERNSLGGINGKNKKLEKVKGQRDRLSSLQSHMQEDIVMKMTAG